MRFNRFNVALLVLVVSTSMLALPLSAAAQSGDYDDVPENAYFATPVAALTAEGLFAGTLCDDGFCPSAPVDRKTMAVWVVRALDGNDPPAVSEPRFTDVDTSSFHAPFVERLADLRITTGCGDGSRFCPDGNVTRGQMAAFLVRAFDLPSASAAGFTDTSGSVFNGDIDALAAARITAGCAAKPTRYCPNRVVPRGQMATFLARALNLVGRPAPPPQPRIAFVSDRDGDNEIFVMNHDGTSPVQLTNNTYRDTSPEWSPAAPRIAYIGYPADTEQVFVVDADSTTVERQLTYGNRRAYSPEWSPDGTRIAYTRGRDIFTISPIGTNLIQITSSESGCSSSSAGTAYNIIWSPNGDLIAYTEWGRDHDGDGHYYGYSEERVFGFCRDFDTQDIRPGIRYVHSNSGTLQARHAARFIFRISGERAERYESRASWLPFGNRVAYDSTASGLRTLTTLIIEAYRSRSESDLVT